MKEFRFLNFDLQIQPSPEGYRSKVVASPAGEPVVEFALPFSDLEIENFLLRFGRTSRTVRGLRTIEVDSARDFGGRLFEAVFAGEVGSCLRSSMVEASHSEAGLRIRLHLLDVPELNDLPWEFLFHSALNHFLALSTETPLVRYIDLPARIRTVAVKPPLEILAVISSPSDYPALDAEAEWQRIVSAVGGLQARGLVVTRRLESPVLA
ncbi:MAG TPA: hypothetical protein VFS60_15100, partial [Thermoanaerobaculia bacterium]|nr:hypothetical protein [Thermoanaerobaculia bacterium]